MKTTSRLFLSLCVVMVTVLLDLWSKAYILDLFSKVPSPQVILSNLNFVMVWNKGMSFGIFNSGGGASLYLGIVTILIILGLCWYLYKTETVGLSLAIAGIIGGAIGNLHDRFIHGAVVDFIDFHVLGYHWYAFNIADSAIVVGVIILFLDNLRESCRKTV